MAILTGRTEMAKAINLEGRKVFTYNLDEKTKYARGSFASVPSPAGRGVRVDCRISRDYQTQGDGIFYLSNMGSCLTDTADIEKYLRFAELAAAPAIAEGDRCAVVVYSKAEKTIEVHTLIAGRVQPRCSDVCLFTEE